MQKYKKIISGAVFSTISFLASLPVLAALDTSGLGTGTTSVNVFTKTETLLVTIRDWFTGVVAILAVIMMLYAAFLFVTGAGDEEKVGKAKDYLKYGIIGMVVAIVSYSAISIVRTTLGL